VIYYEQGNKSTHCAGLALVPGNPQRTPLDRTKKKTETMTQYHKLYTPEDSAIAFIDHQPQMTFGVASIDRATLMNNVTLLAKAAKEFGVPVVLNAVETESFSGYIWPQLN